jgi:predicted nucleic acid-binding protein
MKALEDIFVDSSAWIALTDKDDLHHKEAASAYLSILKNCRILITNNLVIAETYVVLLKELGHRAAIQFLERIKSSPRILVLFSNESIETEAQGMLSKYADQDFSYTDAVCFTIMKQHKISKAFSFDKHFVIAGFANIP